ncbi:MAG: DUF2244 domain-containing protein [Gammaproteobacteria bacterium]
MESADFPQRATRFVIRPNSSLSWRGNKLFFLSLFVVSFTIAVAFAWRGLWMVLPFAGFEMCLLGIALYLCAQRACRCEVVSISDDKVEVAVGRDKPEQRCIFDRYWSQVILIKSIVAGYPSRLLIRSQGREVEVGACLTNDERHDLASALRRAIQWPQQQNS